MRLHTEPLSPRHFAHKKNYKHPPSNLKWIIRFVGKYCFCEQSDVPGDSAGPLRPVSPLSGTNTAEGWLRSERGIFLAAQNNKRCSGRCENLKRRQGRGRIEGWIRTQIKNARRAHTRAHAVVQCSSSFQHNIIWQQRSFRSVWPHTGFAAMGNKIKKPIFLQLCPETQTFQCAMDRNRQSGHNQSKDMHGPSALICP